MSSPPAVDALDRRTGLDPEFVAKQDAQAVVDEQRLRDVAAPLECLHQDPVAGLAVWSEFDEPATALLGLRERRPTELEPRHREALEPAQANVIEASPPLVKPDVVVTLEQRAAGDVIGHAGRPPSLWPFPVCCMELGAMDGFECSLDVDERVARQHELDLRSSGQNFGSHNGA